MAEDLSAHSVRSAKTKICWSDLVAGNVLSGGAEELPGRSVLVATTDQIPAIAILVALVEALINGHPNVQISLVRTKKNPFTGALVVADVVLKTSSCPADDMDELDHDILRHCRKALPLHKVPATINFVPALAAAETGKLLRWHA